MNIGRPLPTFVLAIFAMAASIAGHADTPSGRAPNPAPNLAKAPSAITPPLRKGTVFADCDTCPELVVLPKGTFIMGGRVSPREQPLRPVFIKKPIAMGRFEITFDEWKVCVTEGGCKEMPNDHGWGRERRPVINVTYMMAEDYVRWLSKKTGQNYRLPSEAEWEYGARAGSTTAFWFGDDPGQGRVNCRDCASKWSGKKNAPVGSFAPNPFGLYDMHGNAYEWVADCWVENYKGAPRDGSARRDGDCTNRVIRGGSWYYYQRKARSAARAKNPPQVKSYWLSFRVVREIE